MRTLLENATISDFTLEDFQNEVNDWVLETFGEVSVKQRYYRFGEEALELLQAGGVTKSELMVLMDSVYSKPVGDKFNEIGGTSITLAGIAVAEDMSLSAACLLEIQRCWDRVEEIRKKDKNKPLNSPLPGNAVASDVDYLSLEMYAVSMRMLARAAGINIDNVIPYTRNHWPCTYIENGITIVELPFPIDSDLKIFQAAHEFGHVYYKHHTEDGVHLLDKEYLANEWALQYLHGFADFNTTPNEILSAIEKSLTPDDPNELIEADYGAHILHMLKAINAEFTRRKKQ